MLLGQQGKLVVLDPVQGCPSVVYDCFELPQQAIEQGGQVALGGCSAGDLQQQLKFARLLLHALLQSLLRQLTSNALGDSVRKQREQLECLCDEAFAREQHHGPDDTLIDEQGI